MRINQSGRMGCQKYTEKRGILRSGARAAGSIAVVVGLLLLICIQDVDVAAAMPAPVDNQASYIAWLESTGRPAYSRYRGFAANYSVYRDYRILSYGTPDLVPGNRYDPVGRQYAMHGFSYDEYTLTNTYFRDDTTGISDPRNWKNISLGQDAAVSWMRLTAREKEHIKSASLYYSGNAFGGMSFASLRLTEAQCVVIATPSWNLGFALHTKHYNKSNQLRYGTLNGNGIGGIDVSGSITPVANDLESGGFSIPAGRDTVEIAFDIRFFVSAYNGLARSTDIARGGIQCSGTGTEAAGSGPWNIRQTLRFTRQSASQDMDVHRIVTVKALVWVVSGMGDLVSREVSCTFTLVEKANRPVKGQMSMTGAISLFKDRKTAMGYSLKADAMRFLSLEKVTLRIDFTGPSIPDRVIFHPLGAPDAHEAVTRTGDSSGFAQISYSIAILPSSLTWSNVRIRMPYQCTASAFNGNTRTDYTLSGIEITGDIYDLVYLQSFPTVSKRAKKNGNNARE